MEILVITDSPIVAGSGNSGYGQIATASTSVKVMFTEDIIKSAQHTRGLRFDIVMLPTSIADICDIDHPISAYAESVTKSNDGDIFYY